MDKVCCIKIPIRLPSLANTRWHWAKLARVKKAQKTATVACLSSHELPPLPVVVTIVRLGPRGLDTDNLAASAKAVVDGIAHAYGADDGSEQFEWHFEQRRTKDYGVEVYIRGRE